MARIGSFGAAIRELDPDAEKDTFEFFGQEFTVQAAIPPMLMLHLGAAIAGKAGRMEGSAAIWQALRCALTKPGQDHDDEQFDRFYWLAVNRKATEDTLVDLVFSLVGAQAGKVDEQPPTSPDGPPPTSTPSSSPASDTPGSPALVSVEDRLAGLV